MTEEGGSPIARLVAIMALLRGPGGCDWDRAQSWATIAPYTIEEAYEVADAIARDDPADLKDELGDLLLQVVFHARIAGDAGLFDFDDVAAAIGDKMERRHPHIFGDAVGSNLTGETSSLPGESRGPGLSAGLGLGFHRGGNDLPPAEGPDWETSKAAERAAKGAGGALAGVALGLPALLRAEKLQKRAARVGFDWPDAAGPRAKIDEELAEVEAASPTDREEEVGDLLFSVVNWARHLGVDAEASLRAANAKFERRFAAMEAMAGDAFAASSLDEMEALWTQAKLGMHG